MNATIKQSPELRPLVPMFPPEAEALMAQVRSLLGRARELEIAGEIELADACGARAANKLQSAIQRAA